MNRTEMLQDFVVPEARENLEKAESGILALERQISESGSVEPELLNTIFRCFHTLKGNAGFFELSTIVKVTHEAETLLDLLRDGTVKIETEYIDVLIQVCDFTGRLYDLVEKNENDSGLDEEAAAIIARLCDITEKLEFTSSDDGLTETTKSPLPAQADKTPLQKSNTPQKPKYEIFNKNITEDKSPVQSEKSGSRQSAENVTDGGQGNSGGNGHGAIKKSIRIDAKKLDALLDMVGELVIAESLVTSHPELEGLRIDNFRRAAGQLNVIVRNLQETAVSLRMVPLASVFQRMVRLVRDLSIKSGKKIDLKINGEDTEVDRTITELIADPLVHIIRNSIDHGIETPAERSKIGKSERGVLSLQAGYAGNEVRIIASDDGKGLDRDMIIEKARRSHLIDGDTNKLSDHDVQDLVFMPGFSTANKITDISGRGVGLDVVRKNISRLNGTIDIDSHSGRGTSFILRIPLTLAIIEGMVIRIGSTFFIVPIIEVNETIRLKSLNLLNLGDNYQSIMFRERIIPVMKITDMMSLKSAVTHQHDKSVVIVVGHNSKCIGIIADEIIGNQNVVIKSLRESLGNLWGISGCTILGNGAVGLILDTSSIVGRFNKGENTDMKFDHSVTTKGESTISRG